MATFVEALIRQELQFGRIFIVHAPRDFALQIGRVGAQRLDYRLLVLAEQRLHEDGGMEIGRASCRERVWSDV